MLRQEYPRPQFVRNQWLCLNGEWDFEIDQGDSGLERNFLKKPFIDKINVPFCPESLLSGINNKDFLNSVWYKREITIPLDWKGKNTLLHFQAVDYDTTVWIGDTEVGRHRGGFSPFTLDVYDYVVANEPVTIIVRARDKTDMPQPRGKQTREAFGQGVFYGRTTGIWQTVWLEPVSESHLKRPRITPDVSNSSLVIEQGIVNSKPGLKLKVNVSDSSGGIIDEKILTVEDFTPIVTLNISQPRLKLWSPENPHLYDIDIHLIDDKDETIDSASSYAGLRSVTISDKAVKINGRSGFQRLVLDQGYYPDGLMTAPSDEALIADIELSMKAGFNGARLHQKVFEERFLYHADRMGYLVWGKFGDWGIRTTDQRGGHRMFSSSYITEWLEVLERDYSHPSIVGWCPLNETMRPITDHITDLDDITRGMFLATKASDKTRPVLDTSGYSHRVFESDIYDSHDYEDDPLKFQNNHDGLANNIPFVNKWQEGSTIFEVSVPYAGQPYFVSEFGGIWWNGDIDDKDLRDYKSVGSWGHGSRPKNIQEFYERFTGLCKVLLSNPNMFGYCYTQLTDIDQEQNGIYKYDRSPKFDLVKIRNAQLQPAAIEQL